MRKSGNLKGSKFVISQQFPQEITERRRLVPVMNKARKNDKNAYIVYNKRFINGVQPDFDVPNEMDYSL